MGEGRAEGSSEHEDRLLRPVKQDKAALFEPSEISSLPFSSRSRKEQKNGAASPATPRTAPAAPPAPRALRSSARSPSAPSPEGKRGRLRAPKPLTSCVLLAPKPGLFSSRFPAESEAEEQARGAAALGAAPVETPQLRGRVPEPRCH